jgi:hypothetical protein
MEGSHVKRGLRERYAENEPMLHLNLRARSSPLNLYAYEFCAVLYRARPPDIHTENLAVLGLKNVGQVFRPVPRVAHE